MGERLTSAQKELLAEIREAGVLYVSDNMRYGRTVRVLERKGYVRCVEPDYSPRAQNGWAAAPVDGEG